jgi:type I restriction enzyme S subunit
VLVGRWLNDTLRSPEGQRYLEAWCYAGSTNQVELSATALAAMPIAIPSIKEQRRIAELLDVADEQIRLAESVLSKLRTTRSGLADHLLAAGINDSGRVRDGAAPADDFRPTTLGRRPEKWRVAPLGNFLDRSDYGISSSLSDAGHTPVLRMNNFADGEAKLGELKYSNSVEALRLTLQPGDVLFNRTNSIEHVGRTGIWRGQLAVASFASYLVRLVPNSCLQNEYLNHLLNLRRTQIDLRQWATTGVHQVNVNPTNLRKVIVAVPDSLAEQDRICSALASYDKRIRDESQVLSKLRREKAGLLADLLKGRVRVPAKAAS